MIIASIVLGLSAYPERLVSCAFNWDPITVMQVESVLAEHHAVATEYIAWPEPIFTVITNTEDERVEDALLKECPYTEFDFISIGRGQDKQRFDGTALAQDRPQNLWIHLSPLQLDETKPSQIPVTAFLKAAGLSKESVTDISYRLRKYLGRDRKEHEGISVHVRQAAEGQPDSTTSTSKLRGAPNVHTYAIMDSKALPYILRSSVNSSFHRVVVRPKANRMSSAPLDYRKFSADPIPDEVVGLDESE